MKIARFSVDGGDPRFGIVDDDELVVLAGDPMFQGFDTTGERVTLADAKLLAPVIPRSKVVCVGLNYAEHRQRHGGATSTRPRTRSIFLKPNTAVVGPGDAIQIPPVEGRITHESELVVVIGRIAKQVPKAALGRLRVRVHLRQRRVGPRSDVRRRAVGAREGLRHVRADRTVDRDRARPGEPRDLEHRRRRASAARQHART